MPEFPESAESITHSIDHLGMPMKGTNPFRNNPFEHKTVTPKATAAQFDPTTESQPYQKRTDDMGSLSAPSFHMAINEQLVRWFRRIAVALALIAAAIGGWYLAAWLGGSMAFRGMEVITIKTNTALSILLLGTGLVLLSYRGTTRPLRIFADLCAATAMVIGVLTLSEHLFGWNLGIDQLLAREPPGALSISQPNRMGPPAALSFALAGIALLLLPRRRLRTFFAQSLGLIVFFLGLLGVLGVLYDVRQFYALTRITAIAWPTSLSLILLGLGILLSRTDRGIMRLITADDPGGRMVRRLLPLTVLLPIVLGYFRLTGERMGFYDPATGTGIIILFFIIAFSLLAFVIGQGLSRRYVAQYQARQSLQKSELHLRKSEERFRTLADCMPQLVWTADPDGTVDYYNDRVNHYQGIKRMPDESFKWSPVLHKDDKMPTIKAWQHAFETGEIYQIEHRVQRADGEFYWHLSRAYPVRDKSGRIVKWYGTATDIENVKRTEAERDRLLAKLSVERQRLETILHQLPSGVMIAEAPSGRITYANAYALNVYGPAYPREGADTYLENWKFYDSDGQPFNFDRIPMVRALRGQTTIGQEMRLRKPNGEEWVDLEVNGSPIFDGSRSIAEGVVTLVDITERKKAEAKLRENAARMKASLKEKEILLKEIHHRVKNNMQVVSSLISLQADELQDASLEDTFKELALRVRSMAMIHEKLYQSEDLAWIDFSDYTRNLLEYLWRAYGASSRGIRLALDLEPVNLSVITAVPCGLILNELVSNAIKHAFASRAEGEVTVSLRSDADSRVHLRVIDNGTGFPAALDWENAPSLGLRLVGMLARQIRAEVEISGNEGTEVTIRFKDRSI